MSDESPKRSEALRAMERTDSETDSTPRRRILRNAAVGALAAVGIGGATATADDTVECRVGHGVINGTCYEIECCTDYGTCGIIRQSSHCSDDATDHDCCESFCFGQSC